MKKILKWIKETEMFVCVIVASVIGCTPILTETFFEEETERMEDELLEDIIKEEESHKKAVT